MAELSGFFLNYLWVVWLLSSLFLRLYAFIPIYARKLIARPSERAFGTSRLIFQITTKGNIPIVQETIEFIPYAKKSVTMIMKYGWLPMPMRDLRTVEQQLYPKTMCAMLQTKVGLCSMLWNSGAERTRTQKTSIFFTWMTRV